MNLESQNQPQVLVAEKDIDFARSFQHALRSAGVGSEVARSTREAIALSRKNSSLCLAFVDSRIPEEGGLALMQKLHQMDRRLSVILMSASGSAAAASQAIQRGAEDYVVKPFELSELAEKADLYLKLFQRPHHAAEDETSPAPIRSLDDYVCCSRVMRQVLEEARRTSQSEVPILLAGERGVGKGLLARAIHAASPRANGRYLRIDCPAFARDVLDPNGAQPSASDNPFRRLFEAAANGTLFLSEVGELSQDIQVKLLGILEEVHPMVSVDNALEKGAPRIIASSSRSLADLQQSCIHPGLFPRLTEEILEIPPLRSRREDIIPLAQYFLGRMAGRYGQDFFLSWSSLDLLLRYSLPGNVRELESILERVAAHLLQVPRKVSDGDLRLFLDDSGIPPKRASFDEPSMDLSSIEQLAIERALWFTKGNRTRAAALLGIDRTTLHSKLRRFNKAPGPN